MSIINRDLLDGKVGSAPLKDYPWQNYADNIIRWARRHDDSYSAFAFDLLMSMAYIDTIENLQNNFSLLSTPYKDHRIHLGFINLTVPELLNNNKWIYYKAAKPQSGAIGKLTSELILRFISITFSQIKTVKAIGGSGVADAILIHNDGRRILCEIKASPLTTFPFLFKTKKKLPTDLKTLTRTQVDDFESALYTHTDEIIPLGNPGSSNWPFKQMSEYICMRENSKRIEKIVLKWKQIRSEYRAKNRDSNLYYISNACGQPPAIARENFKWPAGESISDSKTSAGLDRTDDIKKGIYQTMKIGIDVLRSFPKENIKTAIISNLPAYRHGKEYVLPFEDVYWTLQSNNKSKSTSFVQYKSEHVRRPFDYIIALEDGFFRGESFL
jgi:hypothetical protein